ncbi:unnamed protein product [Pipistrellus nathusii]|uniref:Uncharacterized protein n=1 Tax=Pipistrellus nathusii TaxID=59473 RepID=A0ABP0AJH4_PIPNA
MYFQAETVLCSICHAVEWNLGPGLFLTRTCKHSVLTRHSTSPSVCLDCVYCPLSHSCVPLRPHLGLSRRAPVSVLCQRTVGSVLPPEFEALAVALAGACLSPAAAHTALRHPGQPAPLVHPIRP